MGDGISTGITLGYQRVKSVNLVWDGKELDSQTALYLGATPLTFSLGGEKFKLLTSLNVGATFHEGLKIYKQYADDSNACRETRSEITFSGGVSIGPLINVFKSENADWWLSAGYSMVYYMPILDAYDEKIADGTPELTSDGWRWDNEYVGSEKFVDPSYLQHEIFLGLGYSGKTFDLAAKIQIPVYASRNDLPIELGCSATLSAALRLDSLFE